MNKYLIIDSHMAHGWFGTAIVERKGDPEEAIEGLLEEVEHNMTDTLIFRLTDKLKTEIEALNKAIQEGKTRPLNTISIEK